MGPTINNQQIDHPSTADREYLSRQFRLYNDQQSGVFPAKDLHFFAYGEESQIIGGLRGDISWGWLHVDLLWVEEEYRQRGISSTLMDRAEAEAITMDVHQAYLETTDFQALESYMKHGYQVFGQLEDQPPEHIFYYLKNTQLIRK